MDENETPVYWGENLEHELAPCRRLCGKEGSYICERANECVEWRRWHSREMDAIKKTFEKRTDRKWN